MNKADAKPFLATAVLHAALGTGPRVQRVTPPRGRTLFLECAGPKCDKRIPKATKPWDPDGRFCSEKCVDRGVRAGGCHAPAAAR